MNETQAEENPLSQDFDLMSLLKFALPTIVMMLLMGLYTIVDTIFVARFVGTNALSALNIVCPVINLIVGLGTMLATGGSAIIARKMGAGEAVRASQDFTLLIGVGILFFTAGNGSLHFRKPVLDISILAGSCANGFSEMVSQGACAVTTFLFNRIMMKLLGEDGVAAITIIIYTQFLLTALYIGFSMGVAPVISYSYGKQDNAWLKKVFSICMRFIILVSIVIFGLAIVFGAPLISFFAKKETSVYEIARKGFQIFPFSFLFCGLNIFTSATFTALSNGKLSAVLSFLRTFGMILVFLLILPEFMGVAGVWLAVPIAELLTMVVALSFLYRNKDRYHYM